MYAGGVGQGDLGQGNLVVDDFCGGVVDGHAWIPASRPGFSCRTFPCPKFACLEKRRSRLPWLARWTAAGGGKRFGHVASRIARCEMDSIGTPLQVPFQRQQKLQVKT